MSISMYSSQVNRYSSDIASLRAKVADERKKAADANAKALKAMQALGKATSNSQVSSRSRELERYQKQAAGHEKKAADFEKQIANKQRSLNSSQASLDRVQREQTKKDEREAEKRRKAELEHIRRLERERRTHTVMPAEIVARPIFAEVSPAGAEFTDTYDVCLSFAGEQRDYVELIAKELKSAGLKVFYDQDEDIAPRLWGRDLGEYLDYIYRQASRFCLMFISTDYAEKEWTRHERRSALARVIEEGGDYLLPARFDDTELPGLRPTTGYLDLREIAPKTLVDYVTKKLEEAA
jgi:hypothetical protein